MSITIHLKVTKDTVTARLDELKAKIPDVATTTMKEYTDKMAAMAEAQCPVDTGYLLSRIYSTILGPMSVVFGDDASYAGFVDGGTYKMAARPFLTSSELAYERALADALAADIIAI